MSTGLYISYLIKKNTTDLSDFNTEEQWDETKQKEISH